MIKCFKNCALAESSIDEPGTKPPRSVIVWFSYPRIFEVLVKIKESTSELNWFFYRYYEIFFIF
jgi:hypothetical protein